MDITRGKILCGLGVIIISFILWKLYSNGNDISEFSLKFIFSNDDDIKK